MEYLSRAVGQACGVTDMVLHNQDTEKVTVFCSNYIK